MTVGIESNQLGKMCIARVEFIINKNKKEASNYFNKFTKIKESSPVHCVVAVPLQIIKLL